MIEAAMLWNEPNNLSHWDFEIDPEWDMFAGMVKTAANAIRAENPGMPRLLGGISPIDPRFVERMKSKCVLSHVDGGDTSPERQYGADKAEKAAHQNQCGSGDGLAVASHRDDAKAGEQHPDARCKKRKAEQSEAPSAFANLEAARRDFPDGEHR